MLTLEKFEQLSQNPLAKRPSGLSLFVDEGEWTAWKTRLTSLDKHEQYRQLKTVVSELIVADLPAQRRFWYLEAVWQPLERLITQMQHSYVHNPQSACDEQRLCIGEVRSLYFLSILAYQAIIFDVMGRVEKPKTKLFGLGGAGNLVLNGASVKAHSEPKRLYAMSVFRLMGICYKLSMEFALTYQKFPKSFWRLLNGWYLKSALLQVDKLCISQLSEQPPNSIYQQYLQTCLASFTNLFAYRRADILQIFRILPKWVLHITTTFTAESHLRLFVNLKADTPPELISPYASVNPYKDEHVCLFFDATDLFAYLKALKKGDDTEGLGFERRLANMVLLAFRHQADPEANKGTYKQSAVMLVGFGAIYKELSAGKSFNQIIAQSTLKKSHHPKRLFGTHDNHEQEKVRLIRRDDAGAQFIIGEYAQTDEGENQILTRPYLPVFSLFAMKSPRSTHQFPWRLGIVYWAEGKGEHVEVDGRFLGRILSVCGIRLNTRDARSQAFVQAFLIAGDELNQQTTLVLPRYHFKAGDTVVLRVQTKETTLRLEHNLLTTDEIEQYHIVRL